MDPSIILWPTVVLILGLALLFIVREQVKTIVQQRQSALDADHGTRAIAARERQVKVELEESTVTARAELAAAELLEEAAKVRAQAAIHDATHPERIEAERLVIAAQAEGCAERAKADALEGRPRSLDLTPLTEAYKSFMKEYEGLESQRPTWDDWIGSWTP